LKAKRFKKNLSKLNLPKIAVLAKEDMGLPETTKLNAKAFDTAMDAPKVSEPYNKARAIRCARVE
jgi:hypothetical protein